MASPVDLIVGLVGGNPFLVVFFASIAGNMIPFFPVPYLLVVVAVASTFPSLGVIQVAAIGALGAAMGKFVSYGLGYGARRALSGRQARFDSFRKLLGGSAFLVAFLFAASPFPDDVVFIPLGIIRYSPLKTFLSLYSGKFVLTLFVAFAARRTSGALDEVLGGGLVASVLSVVFVVLVAFLLMRVDWEKRLTERRNGVLRRLLRGVKKRLLGSGDRSKESPLDRAGSDEPPSSSQGN